MSHEPLTQEEVQRLNRMEQARESVYGNASLNEQERRMLLTQIELGLNPLKNRQIEQQVLEKFLAERTLRPDDGADESFEVKKED